METELIVAQNDVTQVYRMLPAGTTDDMVIDMWLHDRPNNTRDAYERDVQAFLRFVRKPLRQVNLLDLQSFSDSLVWQARSSTSRTINAVKSLFTFCHKTGYVPINVGAAIRLRKVPSKLAGRILTEEQVLTMIGLEEDPVKHCILRTLYYGGLRVSELCALQWRDIVPNGAAGQINVFASKGDKSRSIPIPESPYLELLALRGDDAIDAPVFGTRNGTHMDRHWIFRIVQEAATRAKLKGVSPHWLRHAHASHALNHKAPIQLVRDTLGHASVATTNQYAHARPNESSATYLPQ